MKFIEYTKLYRSLSEGRSDVKVWSDDYLEGGWAYFSIVASKNGTARKLAYVRVKDERVQKRTYDKNGDDLWVDAE